METCMRARDGEDARPILHPQLDAGNNALSLDGRPQATGTMIIAWHGDRVVGHRILMPGNPDPAQFCARDYWKAQAKIYLGPGATDGLDMAPPPVREGIAICVSPAYFAGGGEFDHGGVVGS